VTRVFVSYAREDQPAVRPLAEGLVEAGHEVWWDAELRGGDRFRDAIEQQLQGADAVLVVWSERARQSRFVMDEAEAGVRGGKLLPIRIDAARLPLGFGSFNVLDFSDWGGDYDSERWRQLLKEIERIGASRGPPGERPPIRIWRHAAVVTAGLTVAFGIATWALYSLGRAAPTSGLMLHPIVDWLVIAFLGCAPVAFWSGIEVRRAGFESRKLVLRRSLVWLWRGGMVALAVLLVAIAADALREREPRSVAIEIARILTVATLFSAAAMAAFNLLRLLVRRAIGARTN
jgi:hypothetical protein